MLQKFTFLGRWGLRRTELAEHKVSGETGMGAKDRRAEVAEVEPSEGMVVSVNDRRWIWGGGGQRSRSVDV